MSKYAVVGGAGASGLALVNKLQAAGHTVYIIDQDKAALEALHQGIKVAIKGVIQERTIQLVRSHTFTPDQLLEYLPCDAVFVCAPNYGAKNMLEGRSSALRTAKRLAAGTPVIELSNGYKTPEAGLTLGVINSPSKIEADKRTLNYLAEGNFKLAIGNDSKQPLASILDNLKAAGVDVDYSKSQAQVVMNKLPEVMPMGIMAILGTKFKDAADEKLPTGILTKAALQELHALAAELKRKGVIETDFGNFDEFYAKQQQILGAKGESPGSLRMMMEAMPPKKTEVDSLYGDVTRLAEEHQINCRALIATHQIIKRMEQRIGMKEPIAAIRAGYTIDPAQPLQSLLYMVGVVSPSTGKLQHQH